MADATVIWTCLPAGVRRSSESEPWKARLSLMISPRLDPSLGGPSLGDFPLFLDWPKTLREIGAGGAEFDIQLRDGARIVATTTAGTTTAAITVVPTTPESLSTDSNTAPDSQLWRRLFDENTPIESVSSEQNKKSPNLRGAPPITALQVFDAGDLLDEMRAAYDKALSYDLGLETEPPGLSAFTLPDSKTRSADVVNSSAVEKFAAFYGLDDDAGVVQSAAPLKQPGAPDFHQLISALGSHPYLLRKLGLLLDFEITLDEFPLAPSLQDAAVRITPHNRSLTQIQHRAMWTAVDYRVGASTRYRLFTVADRGAGNGAALFSAPGQSRVALEQLEHATLALIQQAKKGETSTQGTMPALLQGGMRFSHEGMPDLIANGIVSQTLLEEDLRSHQQRAQRGEILGELLEEPLYAEQLLLGTRADVRRRGDVAWRSLCERSVRYRSGNLSWPPKYSPALEDEGFIEPAVYADQFARPGQSRTTTDVFEWDGWSLVVPRPKASDGDAVVLPPDVLPDGGEGLRATLGVPQGSLQTQRFGEHYSFRLRSVFLAGVGLSLDEANELGSELENSEYPREAAACLRVESAKPPVTVRGQDRGFGEAGDVAVLRDADDPRFGTPEYKLHLLPPEVPLRIAEKHGVFDGLSAAAGWNLIAGHRGRLARDANTSDSNDPSASYESETMPGAQLYAPYLPDPMVRQAVLTLPDNAGTVDLPRFDDLPAHARGKELARSCRLIFRRGKNGVTAKIRGRDVLIDVSPGRVHSFKITAKLTPDDLALLAIAQRNSTNQGSAQPLVERAAKGQLPTLAPSTTITVVYATQRPLQPPAFGRPLILPRKTGSTSAQLADEALSFDRKSTGRLDVYARWEDPVDDPAAPGWTTNAGTMHAGGVEVDLVDGKPLDPIELETMERSPLTHDFGDTRHHEVFYTVLATSRFADFYPDDITDDLANTSLSSKELALHVASTAPPAAPSVAYVLPTFAKEQSGPIPGNQEYKLKHRGAGLRVYLNRGWFSSGAGEQLAVLLTNPDTPGTLRDSTSEWGLNPLRDSAPLPGPLDVTQVWGGDRRIAHWPLTEGSVALVLYDVHWSDEHQLPFVDIELLSQRAFMPLIRLALARFQAHAVPGCELSSVTHADFVPLSPGRAVTATRLSKSKWKLVVHGYSFKTSSTELTQTSGELTSVVLAHIEVMSSKIPEDAAAWRELQAPIRLSSNTLEPWRYHWSGQLEIEDSEFLGRSWRRRIVLREYEVFNADSASDASMEERSRLVSAQTIAI